MSNLPVNPLSAVLKKAAASTTSGKFSELAQRIEIRQKNASQEQFILCDISSSMSDAVKGSRKIDMLRIALRDMAETYPDMRVVYFNSYAIEGKAQEVPLPFGGTALHKGLEYIETFRPKRTIIVSDGQPDNKILAKEVADRMTGRIDVIFCGPETDTDAYLFLSGLARSTGGEPMRWNETRPSLQEPLRRLLT